MDRRISLRAVNLLYLVVILLMAANLAFTQIPQYVRLTLNEAIFIFLPAYLFLRLFEKGSTQSLAERVRWRWPGWKIGLLALLVGAGLYPLSNVIAGVFQQLLGYSNLIDPATVIPTTVGTAILAFIALAVMAPLCEEFLFRGVIQPLYERKGALWGVVFVGFLFIAFHLSLLQGLSIIILSLALGFVFFRSRSLQASILTHFGANFLAVLVLTDGVFKTGAQTWLLSPPALIGGPLIAAAALVGLVLLTRRKQPIQAASSEIEETVAPQPVLRRRGWLSVYWPLAAALSLVWLPMISAEVVFSRSPELLEQFMGTSRPLAINSAPWQEAQDWQYEIRNVAEDMVGEGTCRVVPGQTADEITCTSTVAAYEVRQNNSLYMSSGGSRTDWLAWNRADGRVLEGSSSLNLSDGSYNSVTAWQVLADGIRIQRQDSVQLDEDLNLPLGDTPLANDPGLLVAHSYSWPWQLAGLELKAGNTGMIVQFDPYTWRNETNDQGPTTRTRRVTVEGLDEVTTPAGTFQAWKVTSGPETAWLHAADGLTVVQFFNGIETWALKD